MCIHYEIYQFKGDRFGSTYEEELKGKLHRALESKAKINNFCEKLQERYSDQVKAFDQERKIGTRKKTVET